MSEQKNKSGQEKSGRRSFLLNFGLLTGAAAASGSLLAITGTSDAPAAEEEGEIIRLLNDKGQLVEVRSSAVKIPTGKLELDKSKIRKGIPGKKFVMVVDLGKCRNARKCMEACNKAHHVPAGQEYLKVKKMQESEDTAPYWMPQLCFHCDNPPCTKVCPVDATFKREDGIVAIDNERCIGCRFCMAACPYNARTFNWGHPKDMAAADHGHNCHGEYSPETSLPRKVGTVDKCDFCPDMVRAGELPHCVTACPNGVFYFGDKNEDVVTNGSEIVRFTDLLRDGAGYRFMEGLGTEPSVYYLPPRARQFPFEQGMKNYDAANEEFGLSSEYFDKKH